MIQTLLLLMVLTGPLHGIARASTIVAPTSPAVSAAASEESALSAATKTAEEEDTKATSQVMEITSRSVTEQPMGVSTESSTDGQTEGQRETTMDSTSGTGEVPSMFSTTAVPHAAEGPAVTEAPLSDAHTTPAEDTGTKEELLLMPTVLVEETEGALTTGQVVGIAVGALLALAIVVAVAAMAVRRMGQYS
ncbi:hypothetical protein Z043_108254 [Scleropages formosus]|uniref:Podoplanin-like n=1 Tax=Scleropages formosus TaxID=113540 RepID=A0A0P7VC52_SCLFO|nr:hypothetical protein Z043_108254 [Scleropages formosus]